MSMKITVPWQIRRSDAKSGPPRRRNWWSRKHFREENLSEPLRSVTMKEDDLDHLGTRHQVIEQLAKR